MGLLSEGSPLSWEETKKHADHVRKQGIIQFINLYRKVKDRENDCLLWGDEVEYNIVRLDREKKQAHLLLNAGEHLNKLQEAENTYPNDHPTTWRPEYAAYMIEGTPGKPYGYRMANFNMVEANMKLRRDELNRLLGEKETALSLVVYPRLGCGNFTYPESSATPQEGASRSLFYPDSAIFGDHPRFKTLTRNIRERRGEKVAINIPIYKDKNTPSPFIEDLSQYGDDGSSQRAAKPDHIYMDAMGFGMGCSCLQMTFQACNIDEARHLYDQLTPLCPLLLALSAACPIQRGYLADTDCRWNTIAQSVDCRTKEEQGLKPLQNDRFVIHKSRYDSIDSYLSPCSAKYNDIHVVLDQAIYKQLCDSGIDHLLAQHIAHLFIRDPVSLFSEKVNQNNEQETDHFENIQSTNWQTMRFKPPPPNSPIGWRVEFRPTEVQLTDFENAAFSCFIVLLTRAILSFGLNFVIPISEVDSNMRRSQKKDAILKQKFYFRKDVFCQDWAADDASEEEIKVPDVDCAAGIDKHKKRLCRCRRTESFSEDYSCEYTEMTADEIINGKGLKSEIAGEFPGLIPLIQKYLASVDDLDVDTSCTIQQYLKLIQDRASGKLKTSARWMRDFVVNHPEYKQDSVVSEKISYDLIDLCDKVTKQEIAAPGFLPVYSTKSGDNIPAAMQKAETFNDDKAQIKHNSLTSNMLK